MRHEKNCNTTDTLRLLADEKHVIEAYVWSTSEKAKLRAISLYIIRSIVERHGGTIEIDLATNTIHIDVPKEEEVACAQEIEEQGSAMCV